MGIIMLVAGFVGLVVGASIWRGLALSILWGWFIVPLGLPPIGIAIAIGLSLTLSVLVPANRSKGEDITQEILAAFITPLIALCFGWVVHQFV